MGQVHGLKGRMPRQMAMRRMAAQCIMARLSESAYYTKDEERARIINLVEKEGIGGICVFAGSLTGTANILADLQRKAKIPILFSGDFEHGLTMRLDEGTSFPHALALGNANDLELTRQVARSIAREMKVVGLHWNFAPVCDVYSNPLNPVIHLRSFNADAAVVAANAEAFISGLQEEHILASAKHFPGHGDSKVDSHHELPVLELDRERLNKLELEPFRRAIAAGVKSIMVGHLSIPALDPSGTPASLSKPIITGLLREELGFEGLIVTDALDMKAISDSYSSEEAVLAAIGAGADIALLPEDPLAGIAALERAIRSNLIPRERVQESVERILEAKKWAGAIRTRNTPGLDDLPQFSLDDHRKIALDTSGKALQWFGEPDKVVPLDKHDVIAGIALVEDEDVPEATRFFRYLSQLYENDCHFAFVDHRIREDEVQELLDGTDDARVVVLPVFAKSEVSRGGVRISGRLVAIAERMARRRRPTVAVLFENPNVKDTFPATAYLCTFSNSEGSLASAAKELVEFGAANPAN